VKKSVFFILLVGLSLVALILMIGFKSKQIVKINSRPPVTRAAPPTTPLSPLPLPTTNLEVALLNNRPANKLTPEGKAELKRVFDEILKPAIDKWADAYKGHIPFNIPDVTLEKFYAMSGGCYTFMIGSTTFVVLHNQKYTKVFYLMTKQRAHDLNSIPTDGKPRDLSVPITREEVLPMAEADTGLHYELKDIVIKPTGAYCTIDGGADVEVGIKYENGMELARLDNLSFTIGKDGKFITYQH